jgi:hypothetical protein
VATRGEDSTIRSIEIKLLRHKKKAGKKAGTGWARGRAAPPEAPGPAYSFKNNNKNFTTFLLLLISLVVRGGGGGAPDLLLLVKGKRRA